MGSTFDSEKTRLGWDVRDNVNGYESDVKGAAESDSGAAARIARIRSATDRAKSKLDESERKTIEKIEQLPPAQQDQLVDLWEEAANTLTGLIENILNRVVQMIVNFIRNVVQTVSDIFNGAKRILGRLFGW